MQLSREILRIMLAIILLTFVGCKSEKPTYNGRDFIMFASESQAFGVVDSSDEWFEVMVSAARPADIDRYIGVEVIATESNAIEGLHFELESNTLCIKAGELTTAVRIRGIAENIYINQQLDITLGLVLDKQYIWDEYDTTTRVTLQRCCKFDINTFTGYAVLTSTWCMQYMNVESRLVKTHVASDDSNIIVIEDMYYEDYDVRIELHSNDLLNPIATLCGEQVVGSTGEAFGTIYGNGELMMAETIGYTSYYSTCERFAVLYATIYVEEVGTVGTYVNILEWVSDDEAERIMREGF